MSYGNRGRSAVTARLRLDAAIFMAGASRRSAGDRWTPDHVRERLLQAVRTLAKVVGRVRPREFGNGLPDPVQPPLALLEMIEQMSDPDLHKVEQSVAVSTLSHDISLAEEAIRWPYLYLIRAGLDGPNRVLMLYLRTASRRRSFRRLARERGWSASTVNAALDKAFRTIAAGLERDGVIPR